MNIKRILFSAVAAAGILVSCAGCSGQSGSSGNVDAITLNDGDKIAVIEIKDYGTMKAKLFPDIAPIGVENFIQLANKGYYNGLKIHRVLQDNVIQGGSLYGDGTGGTAVYTGEDEAKDTTSAATTFPIEVNDNARNFYGALGYVADSYGQNAVQFYIINNKTSQDIHATDASKVQSRADELASAAQAATYEASSNKAKSDSYQQTYYSNNAKMLTTKNEVVAAKYAKVGGVYQYDGAYTVFGQVYEGLDVLDKISAVTVQTNAQGEKSMPIGDIVISSITIETITNSTAEATTEAASASKSDSTASSTPAKTAEASAPSDSKVSTTETSSAPTAEASAAEKQTAQATSQTAEISTVDTKEAQ